MGDDSLKRAATENATKDAAYVAAKNIFSSPTRPSKILENINIENLTSQQAQELLKKISGASNPKEGFRSLRSKFHPDKFSNLNDKKISELANKESTLVNRLWEKTGL